MKKTITILTLIAALSLAMFGTSCLKDKVLQIILTTETCWEFMENETSATWVDPETVDFAAEVDQALLDNGYSRGDIAAATLLGGHYGVTSFAQATDWLISGRILVTRGDISGPDDTLIVYTSESVPKLRGVKKVAELTDAGTAVLQQALDDYLDGDSPTLTFTVSNGSVSPLPTPSSPIIFDWKAWISIQIQLNEDVEVVDPF